MTIQSINTTNKHLILDINKHALRCMVTMVVCNCYQFMKMFRVQFLGCNNSRKSSVGNLKSNNIHFFIPYGKCFNLTPFNVVLNAVNVVLNAVNVMLNAVNAVVILATAPIQMALTSAANVSKRRSQIKFIICVISFQQKLLN